MWGGDADREKSRLWKLEAGEPPPATVTLFFARLPQQGDFSVLQGVVCWHDSDASIRLH